jgi:hypothetical protein
MLEFNQIFSELFTRIADLNKRIRRFETWEPSEGSPTVGAHAYLTSNQVTIANTWTTIVYDSELWDTDSIHASGVFTAPIAGKYYFNAYIPQTTFVGTLFVRFEPSVANKTMQVNPNANFNPVTISGIFDLAAGENVRLQVYRASVGATIGSSPTFGYYSFTQMELLSI